MSQETVNTSRSRTDFWQAAEEALPNEFTPVGHGPEESFAHEDSVKPIRESSPATMEDGLPEEELYAEVMDDLTIMEQTLREQEGRIEQLRETYETHLDLVQLIVGLFFPLWRAAAANTAFRI